MFEDQKDLNFSFFFHIEETETQNIHDSKPSSKYQKKKMLFLGTF